MASVTSLDKDMRKLRMDRYTPQAANEARTFIEESLGEPLAKPDLLDSLKDGVALCKYDFSDVGHVFGKSLTVALQTCQPCIAQFLKI